MQNNQEQKPRVLIVDDDRQNLVQISAALAYLDAEIDSAAKAKEAIYLINSHSYAVMIFDVNMPEMDGFELAEIIHSGYANTKTPIIFISGVYFDEMSVFKGYRTGAVDYLTKPLNMNILISKVQVFLELDNMYNELQLEKAKSLKALEEKTMAIGTVSHEIKNPLSAITGIIDVLEMECENSELKTYIHIMKSSANHMNRLLSDLTDYTKIETGHIVLETVSFNIRKEIDMIVQSFRFQTNISQNEFTYEIHDDVPDILEGDITRFTQIIYNLLGNANKFTRDGHIHLSVDVEQITQKHLHILTKVSDNGIGMTDEEQKDLFLPFSQSNKSINRKYGGSGLGLSISKELSKILGGDIHLTSKKGEGSTISFTSKFKIPQ
jgi:signal transduction histidine kinase